VTRGDECKVVIADGRMHGPWAQSPQHISLVQTKGARTASFRVVALLRSPTADAVSSLRPDAGTAGSGTVPPLCAEVGTRREFVDVSIAMRG